MSESYKSAMDKIKMSDELKEKIIGASAQREKKKKIIRPVYIGAAAALAACVALVFSVGGMNTRSVDDKSGSGLEVAQNSAPDTEHTEPDSAAEPEEDAAAAPEADGAGDGDAGGTNTSRTGGKASRSEQDKGSGSTGADGTEGAKPESVESEPDQSGSTEPEVVASAIAPDNTADRAEENEENIVTAKVPEDSHASSSSGGSAARHGGGGGGAAAPKPTEAPTEEAEED